MDSTNHRLEALETDFLKVITSNHLDISLDGQVLVEQVRPHLIENDRLSYLICPARSVQHTKVSSDAGLETQDTQLETQTVPAKFGEGGISGQLHLILKDEEISVSAEINIKKFITPQLSLSSAHVAVLIHQLKTTLRKLKIQSNPDDILAWKLDRVQRRFQSSQVHVSIIEAVRLLMKVIKVISKINTVSVEIIQEEAEYYRAIERWEHSRRAYFTWLSLAPMPFEDLQNFLSVLQKLKDWPSCLQALDRCAHEYEPTQSSKLLCAASILCRDVFLDLEKAQKYALNALSLTPEKAEYKRLVEELRVAIESKEPIKGVEAENIQSKSSEENSTLQNTHRNESQQSDDDQFFDDLSSHHDLEEDAAETPFLAVEEYDFEESEAPSEESEAPSEDEADQGGVGPRKPRKYRGANKQKRKKKKPKGKKR